MSSLFHVGVIVGFGGPVQSHLAPFESQLVLTGVGQHLRHVVEDSHGAETTGLIVQFRAETRWTSSAS